MVTLPRVRRQAKRLTFLETPATQNRLVVRVRRRTVTSQASSLTLERRENRTNLVVREAGAFSVSFRITGHGTPRPDGRGVFARLS